MKRALVSLLISGMILNSLATAAAPSRTITSPEEDGLATGFARFHRIGDVLFASELKKIAPGDDISEAISAQSAYFIERYQAAILGQFEKGVAKSREINKKRREGTLKAPARPRVPRNYGKNSFDLDQVDISPTALFGADGIQVVETETDNGVSSTALEQKTIETAEVTVNRNQVVSSEVGFDGTNRMSKSMGTEETVETISKADGKKLGKTSKMSFAASLDVCPDFEGVIRGTGTAKFYSQTTINTGKQLAALTSEYTVDFRVTGYVSDDAEMTHFDLKGTVIEKKLGFDRAVRMGMIESAGGNVDGTRSAFVQFDGNTPPTTSKGEYGMSRNVSPTLGRETFKPLPTNTDADSQRLREVASSASGAFITDLDLLMRSSISRWQNYECVGVKCTPAKTVLAPNESVEVTAESFSELDKSRFNAKLNAMGTETVTPAEQEGKPTAVYSLKAPDKEKATIIVKSVSRRGIGLEVLEIPVQDAKKKPPMKKPAPKPKSCDQGWTGTVKAVRTFSNLERGKASGSLLRQTKNVSSTYTAEVTLVGTRDLTAGITNNFHGNARGTYEKEETRERNYGPMRMSCSGKMMESPETQKNVLTYRGDSSGQTLVAVAINGNVGHISFSPPPMMASFVHSYIYETACPAYNQVNTKTVRSDSLQEIAESGFEVDFNLDPSSPNVLVGSKTVQEPDGSSTTYTWNLSRCQ